jgi:hypothetical protein
VQLEATSFNKIELMKICFFISVLLFIVFSSCQSQNKYSAQLATADTLVHALYAYDTSKVNSMIGVDPEDIGEGKEGYDFKLKAAKRMLQENGLPKDGDVGIKEYPQNSADLIDVITTFKKSGQSITIRFVKFLPANKIAFFRLDGPIILERTIAPLKF